jgi:thiol-disulfide isomerase/thioredoxin
MKRAARQSALPAAWAIVAMAGCGPAAVESAPEPAAVSLRATDVEGYHETLARLHGNVVLVDFWATWCAPCIEQFPHTLALERKYRGRGLAVVAVSLNEPGEAPQVREFLERHAAAPLVNLLSNYASGVRAIEAFGLPGPVPCYRLYDRRGVLRREFVVEPRAARQFTAADIEAAVVELL